MSVNNTQQCVRNAPPCDELSSEGEEKLQLCLAGLNTAHQVLRGDKLRYFGVMLHNLAKIISLIISH